MEMRFVYNSEQSAMFRVKTLRWFERMIRAILERHEKPYRLFISYKCRHRIKKKLADRCFMWDETEETRDGIDVESGEKKASESRDSTAFGQRYSSQTNASSRSARRRLVEVGKRCSVVCICADD